MTDVFFSILFLLGFCFVSCLITLDKASCTILSKSESSHKEQVCIISNFRGKFFSISPLNMNFVADSIPVFKVYFVFSIINGLDIYHFFSASN